LKQKIFAMPAASDSMAAFPLMKKNTQNTSINKNTSSRKVTVMAIVPLAHVVLTTDTTPFHKRGRSAVFVPVATAMHCYRIWKVGIIDLEALGTVGVFFAIAIDRARDFILLRLRVFLYAGLCQRLSHYEGPCYVYHEYQYDQATYNSYYVHALHNSILAILY
jgi:hypothetical protein